MSLTKEALKVPPQYRSKFDLKAAKEKRKSLAKAAADKTTKVLRQMKSEGKKPPHKMLKKLQTVPKVERRSIKSLGQGAQGSVHEGVNPFKPGIAAVKVFKKHHRRGASATTEAKNTIKAREIAEKHVPSVHVPKVFGVKGHKGKGRGTALVTEKVKGRSVGDIERRGKKSIKWADRDAKGSIRADERARRKWKSMRAHGAPHPDFHEGNYLVGKKGRISLLDWSHPSGTRI
jgi:hypothetical protein